ncbi:MULTISPECIES: DUF6243 family protein [Streptomyces]|uniref:Small EDRK-rich factor-like N-terminal domain-containing protein n=1 Tax=Streptomyces rubiginosohelvolus TaxID=67362 RepID=A0ABQ3CAB9_9ACTN|nr:MULTISPECIES: DUF6243 family protein [Streptomyces]RUP68376.1 hypothetical protein SSPNP10_13165 [Streptomyces sp. NP10]GGR89062.1 hypothetical protein GCM10010284_22720 [Streptomyces rubiginosohelvolus]GGZ77932.1 hypothetical protein GCM10010328_60930 [Streptomyces pluricolorescens]
MAKSRNNLLGVGGQRKKLSRADQQGAGSARTADRKVAEDKKQELVRKMRERAEAQPAATAEPSADENASSTQS